MEAIALLSLIAVMSAISRNGESSNEAFIALFVAFAVLTPFCICIFYIGKAIKTVLSGLSEEQMEEKKRKLAARAPIPMVNVIDIKSTGDKANKLKDYMEVNVYDTDAVSEVEMATCDIHQRAIDEARVLEPLEGDDISTTDRLSDENTKSNADEEQNVEALSIIQTDKHGNDSDELQEQSPKTMETTFGKEDKLDNEVIIADDLHGIKDETTGEISNDGDESS
eukprot:43617_1